MKSGIEDNTPNVNDSENEIKIDEKSNNVSSEQESIPNDKQVETQINNVEPGTSRNVQKLPSCLKPRNSDDNIASNEKKSLLKNKSQNSDTNLVAKPSGLSKILTWDPWHKIGRNKSKKDKRKNDPNMTATDHKTGDGPQTVKPEIKIEEKPLKSNLTETNTSEIIDESKEDDNLKPKQAKVRKIVRFNANVKVVHYAEDEVLAQTTEPLKKELEQQERNKELRKEVTPETGIGLKTLKKSASDYMAAWYKK